MKFNTSIHAQTRMFERCIELESVKNVVRNPSQLTKLEDCRIKVIGKAYNNKDLVVVYEQNGNNIEIITTYYEG